MDDESESEEKYPKWSGTNNRTLMAEILKDKDILHDFQVVMQSLLTGEPVSRESLKTADRVGYYTRSNNPEPGLPETLNMYDKTRSSNKPLFDTPPNVLKFADAKLPSDDEDDEEFQPKSDHDDEEEDDHETVSDKASDEESVEILQQHDENSRFSEKSANSTIAKKTRSQIQLPDNIDDILNGTMFFDEEPSKNTPSTSQFNPLDSQEDTTEYDYDYMQFLDETFKTNPQELKSTIQDDDRDDDYNPIPEMFQCKKIRDEEEGRPVYRISKKECKDLQNDNLNDLFEKFTPKIDLQEDKRRRHESESREPVPVQEDFQGNGHSLMQREYVPSHEAVTYYEEDSYGMTYEQYETLQTQLHHHVQLLGQSIVLMRNDSKLVQKCAEKRGNLFQADVHLYETIYFTHPEILPDMKHVHNHAAYMRDHVWQEEADKFFSKKSSLATDGSIPISPSSARMLYESFLFPFVEMLPATSRIFTQPNVQHTNLVPNCWGGNNSMSSGEENLFVLYWDFYLTFAEITTCGNFIMWLRNNTVFKHVSNTFLTKLYKTLRKRNPFRLKAKLRKKVSNAVIEVYRQTGALPRRATIIKPLDFPDFRSARYLIRSQVLNEKDDIYPSHLVEILQKSDERKQRRSELQRLTPSSRVFLPQKHHRVNLATLRGSFVSSAKVPAIPKSNTPAGSFLSSNNSTVELTEILEAPADVDIEPENINKGDAQKPPGHELEPTIDKPVSTPSSKDECPKMRRPRKRVPFTTLHAGPIANTPLSKPFPDNSLQEKRLSEGTPAKRIIFPPSPAAKVNGERQLSNERKTVKLGSVTTHLLDDLDPPSYSPCKSLLEAIEKIGIPMPTKMKSCLRTKTTPEVPKRRIVPTKILSSTEKSVSSKARSPFKTQITPESSTIQQNKKPSRITPLENSSQIKQQFTQEKISKQEVDNKVKLSDAQTLPNNNSSCTKNRRSRKKRVPITTIQRIDDNLQSEDLTEKAFDEVPHSTPHPRKPDGKEIKSNERLRTSVDEHSEETIKLSTSPKEAAPSPKKESTRKRSLEKKSGRKKSGSGTKHMLDPALSSPTVKRRKSSVPKWSPIKTDSQKLSTREASKTTETISSGTIVTSQAPTKITHEMKESRLSDDDLIFRKLRETAMNNIQRDTGFFELSGKPVIFEGTNTLTKMPHNMLLNQLSKLSESYRSMIDSLQRGNDKESFCDVLRQLVLPSEDSTEESISKLIIKHRDKATNDDEELLDTSTNTTTFIPAHSIFKDTSPTPNIVRINENSTSNEGESSTTLVPRPVMPDIVLSSANEDSMSSNPDLHPFEFEPKKIKKGSEHNNDRISNNENIKDFGSSNSDNKNDDEVYSETEDDKSIDLEHSEGEWLTESEEELYPYLRTIPRDDPDPEADEDDQWETESEEDVETRKVIDQATEESLVTESEAEFTDNEEAEREDVSSTLPNTQTEFLVESSSGASVSKSPSQPKIMEEKSEMLTEDNGSITEEAESTLNTSDFESTIESTFSQRSEDDESDHEPDEDGVFNYLTGGDEFPEHENPVLKPPYKTFKPPFTFSEAMKFTPSKQIYLSHVDQRDFVFWKILVFMYEYPPHVFTEENRQFLSDVTHQSIKKLNKFVDKQLDLLERFPKKNAAMLNLIEMNRAFKGKEPFVDDPGTHEESKYWKIYFSPKYEKTREKKLKKELQPITKKAAKEEKRELRAKIAEKSVASTASTESSISCGATSAKVTVSQPPPRPTSPSIKRARPALRKRQPTLLKSTVIREAKRFSGDKAGPEHPKKTRAIPTMKPETKSSE